MLTKSVQDTLKLFYDLKNLHQINNKTKDSCSLFLSNLILGSNMSLNIKNLSFQSILNVLMKRIT